MNKVGSYYHPRDIERWLGLDRSIDVPEEQARLNEATKKRTPLVLYGKGKACAKLKMAAIEALNVELKEKTFETAELFTKPNINTEPLKDTNKDEKDDNTPEYTLELSSAGFALEDLFKKQPEQLPDKDSVVSNEIHEEKETLPKLPDGFVVLGSMPGAKCFTEVKDVCAVMPAAVLVPSPRPDLLDVIKSLRRERALAAVPLVVLGDCDAAACHAVGADECLPELDFTAVERIRLRAARMRELWNEANKDDLTGLYKRDFLKNYLTDQERRYRETGVSFSVMMADLDHFKQVNDTYGHPAGDAVLIAFGEFLRNSLRAGDIATRYGGEEFVVGFARTDVKEAAAIAERLCRIWR